MRNQIHNYAMPITSPTLSSAELISLDAQLCEMVSIGADWNRSMFLTTAPIAFCFVLYLLENPQLHLMLSQSVTNSGLPRGIIPFEAISVAAIKGNQEYQKRGIRREVTPYKLQIIYEECLGKALKYSTAILFGSEDAAFPRRIQEAKSVEVKQAFQQLFNQALKASNVNLSPEPHKQQGAISNEIYPYLWKLHIYATDWYKYILGENKLQPQLDTFLALPPLNLSRIDFIKSKLKSFWNET